MAFPEDVKTQAFARSGGRCECVRLGHGHYSRCVANISRGSVWAPATVEFHHLSASALGGHDGLSNCQALCIPCHKSTDSYGRPA
jgi:5-methylcytosine-specific restriction endonuclease McrA